jgi:hypothetical protein
MAGRILYMHPYGTICSLFDCLSVFSSFGAKNPLVFTIASLSVHANGEKRGFHVAKRETLPEKPASPSKHNKQSVSESCAQLRAE